MGRGARKNHARLVAAPADMNGASIGSHANVYRAGTHIACLHITIIANGISPLAISS